MRQIQPTTPAGGGRLLSLDIFRGITIAAMITVNDPGIEERVYAPLEHAKWNGFTPTDLVFPSFIFIAGVSVALSYSGQTAKGISRGIMIRKTLRRAFLLFTIGVLLSILPYFDYANYRIPGVLQRIAIVYTACALLFLYTGWKTQAWLFAILLTGYWLAMTLVPVPGYGHTLLEPGRNLAAWLDAIVIPGRLWQGSWDPEGVLSTLPAIASGIAGMLTGQLLLTGLSAERKILGLFLAGFLAYLLSLGWNTCFPINKNLWTSSFVLHTAGLDSMILASLYFIVDLLGYKRWSKWALVFGSNAITAYLVAEAFGDLLTIHWGDRQKGFCLQEWIIGKMLPTGISPELLSLLWALAFCSLCFIPIYYLYHKKISLKI
ncbi:MAG TPA: heparan-alpha-glucosaminide N-acetyltransferase domain-containing protein [Puia sp.]|nr:heparan-alpha-glucosaminide N-acetyltransferase domain-containing protein [Puia sp.]